MTTEMAKGRRRNVSETSTYTDPAVFFAIRLLKLLRKKQSLPEGVLCRGRNRGIDAQRRSAGRRRAPTYVSQPGALPEELRERRQHEQSHKERNPSETHRPGCESVQPEVWRRKSAGERNQEQGLAATDAARDLWLAYCALLQL